MIACALVYDTRRAPPFQLHEPLVHVGKEKAGLWPADLYAVFVSGAADAAGVTGVVAGAGV